MARSRSGRPHEVLRNGAANRLVFWGKRPTSTVGTQTQCVYHVICAGILDLRDGAYGLLTDRRPANGRIEGMCRGDVHDTEHDIRLGPPMSQSVRVAREVHRKME